MGKVFQIRSQRIFKPPRKVVGEREKSKSMRTAFASSFASLIKKIITIPIITIQGVVLGISLNFVWHYFLARIIGWKDTAPDWYFNMQETVFVFIFLLGLIGWLLFNFQSNRKRRAFLPRDPVPDLHRELGSDLSS